MKKAKTPWTVHILTLFPEMFPGPLGFSIIGKALEEKNQLLELIKLQNFSKKGPPGKFLISFNLLKSTFPSSV